MSKDLSTQIPNPDKPEPNRASLQKFLPKKQKFRGLGPRPPELQPIPSVRSKVWRSLSLILTIGGLALMGAGGWMFVQQRIEANKPPPARILEVSVSDLESTPTPTLQLSFTPKKPTSTAESVAGPETATPQNTSPTSMITSLENIVEEDTINQEEIAESEVESTSAPATATATLDPTVTPNVLAAKLVEETTLSLADNPLLVVEDEENPESEEAQLETIETDQISDPSVAAEVPLTRIVAENINMDSEVTEVGWQQIEQNGVIANVWTVADWSAGWHRNSKLPGQRGNIVLSAHHNIKGEVFRYTVDLEPGDTVTLYDEDQSYKYVVEDKFIVKDKGEPEAVRRENAKWIGPFNEERLTLVTCWPYNNNTHRLIVIAKPVEPS